MADRQLKRFHRPDPPMFFKVIESPIDREIAIPAMFVRKCPDLLDSDSVMLVDPAGNAWRVQLARDDYGAAWLRAGFKEFGEFYGLKSAYILLFQSIGKSQFRVTIFGKSTLEIGYPMGGNQIFKPEVPQFCIILGHPIEEGLEIPSKFVRKCARILDGGFVTLIDLPGAAWPVELAKYDNGDAWLQKGLRKFGKFYTIEEDDLVAFKTVGKSQFEVTIFDGTTATEINYPIKATTDRRTGAGTSRAPPRPSRAPRSLPASERASAFRSEYPFFINSSLTDYDIQSGVSIPQQFLHQQFGGNREPVILRLPPPQGLHWRVTLHVKKYQTRLSGGWRRFVLENELQPGNACVFEWYEDDRAFTVHILR